MSLVCDIQDSKSNLEIRFKSKQVTPKTCLYRLIYSLVVLRFLIFSTRIYNGSNLLKSLRCMILSIQGYRMSVSRVP